MNQRVTFLRCLALATALISETGAAPARAETAAAPPLAETVWRLVEVHGKPIAAPADAARQARLVLHALGGRFEGYGGCNSFSGSYETGAVSAVRFRDVASTMMACPELETETLFLQVLNQADGFALEGGRLSLSRGGMAPLARFEAAP